MDLNTFTNRNKSKNIIARNRRTTLSQLVIHHVHILANQQDIFITAFNLGYLLFKRFCIRNNGVRSVLDRKSRLGLNEFFKVRYRDKSSVDAIVQLKISRR